jgi:TrkA domain protein
MVVKETDLPGVGKKFEFSIGGESTLVVVIHNTGKREVYRQDDPDADAEKLFELSDQLARKFGTVLEGAYFQPIADEAVDAALDDEHLIEWVKITPDSPLAERTLGETDLRERSGASVIAIQRGDQTLTNPDAEMVIEADDTLVAIGDVEAHAELEALAAPEDES